MVKPRLYGDETETKKAAIWTLRTVLTDALKLLHPYMPFITEEIYCTLKEAEGTLTSDTSIMISDWPVYSEARNYQAEKEATGLIKEAVKAIRALRTGMNVPPSRKAKTVVVSENAHTREIFERGKVFFATLGYASEVVIQSDKTGIDADAVSAVIPNAVLYIPFADLVDIDKEIERLTKEQTRLTSEIKRSTGMLSNEKFVSKAPAAKVEEEKAKLEKYQAMLSQVEERLAHLGK
jgi:valyl-tRNA synthetase